MRSFLRPISLGALILTLGACVVGPDYHGPPALAPRTVAPKFLRADAAIGSAAPAPRWWPALGDSELNRLEERALLSAPDLAIGTARVRQARAGLRLRRADRFPRLDATGAALRETGSSFGAGERYGAAALDALGRDAPDAIGLDEAGLDAVWEPDLFGARARAVEGARAAAQASDFNADDARVVLTAEIAQAYVRLRALQERLAIAMRTSSIEERLLELTRMRQAGGNASEIDVVRLSAQLESARAALAPLRADAAEQQDRLAALLGAGPGALDAELTPPAPVPAPPRVVAVGDPAALLRRRPDVRAAERRIAQQTAQVGERTADYFPKVTLVGEIGIGSVDLGQLLSAGGTTMAVLPVLHWSPFDFGRTRARVEQADGMRDEAKALYVKTVLNALQDAETALTRYGREKEHLAGLLRVRSAAVQAAHLMSLRLQGGTATTLDVLDVERQRAAAEADVSQARAELTEDFIALQKSLGLGWQTAAEAQPHA